MTLTEQASTELWVVGQTGTPQFREGSSSEGLTAMYRIKTELAQQLCRPSAPLRGLIGMAFTLDLSTTFDAGRRALLPNEGLRAWAMIDVGRSYRGAVLSELAPEWKHGRILTLVPSGRRFDLSPAPEQTANDPNWPQPIPTDDWFLDRLAAQMDWTISATAARAQRWGWKTMTDALTGLSWPSPVARHAVEHRPSPHIWAPTPYVQSSLTAGRATSGFRLFSLAVRLRFLDDLRARTPVLAPCAGPVRVKQRRQWLVLSGKGWEQRVFLAPQTELYLEPGDDVPGGTILARDWPTFSDSWHREPLRWRWRNVLRCLGADLPAFFTNWWERQRLGDWLPLALAACEPLQEPRVAWDFPPALAPYFDEILEAYMPPPVFPQDLTFHGELAHGITYDFRALLY